MHGYHLRNVQRLVEWTRAPVGTPIPPARGTWNLVFADLNRRSRLSYEMREQLASSLERFRDASQAMPDGILYLSADDRIEWMNHKAEQHFGLEAGRDCGLPVTKLVRQPDFVRFMHDGGRRHPWCCTPTAGPADVDDIRSCRSATGKGWSFSRDISQLERLDTMRRDFVANVSHELRTPLTVVIGFLETLVDGLEDSGRTR